ncbi:hypothetical protein EC973_005358 [Apophysomyces ossiformis]|uniref:Major facilitator superfamily (MFS) profile domain-containing protein n=1 Tax=Apophysomyces ossiformis TaxID=679940 RepID=A0A8H7BF53_9FUNG|nr:hypothetical protein EC973_005358 [Apophysomyces ossiformis]
MATTIQIKEINEQTITSGRSIYDEKVLKDNDQQEPLDGRKEVDEATIQGEEEGPDGGYGWFIVLGAFMVQCTSFGTATSVMQDYYERHVFGIESSVQLSFVGTLALVFINLMGPVAQILRSIVGLRMVMVIGMLLITIGLEMAGFAWQMAVAPQYFTRRRGLALGLIASGSGIGGLVIPFIMSPINSSIGPAWTYRVMGFVCLACDLVAVALIKELKPAPKQRKKFTDIVKFGVLKDGSALVAVAATANFVGRILAGIMADRIGRINTNIIITILGGLSSFLIWTFAFTYGVMMAFAVIFGLFCGSYFALLSPITASILGMERFPSGLSLLLITNIISVFGPNISGGIEASVSDIQPYFVYKMFTGACYLAGSVFLIALKLRMDKNPFAKI